MKTLDYLNFFNELSAREKYNEIKTLRNKLKELRKKGISEDELRTVKALVQWTAGNLFCAPRFKPTIEDLKEFMYSGGEIENEI
jgi:hypothetical protein